MNDSADPTLIENLSVETFLQVFASLSLSEIVEAFSGLHSRIDSSIEAMTTATHTVTYNETRAVEWISCVRFQFRLIDCDSHTFSNS